jgi:hypothetical protein
MKDLLKVLLRENILTEIDWNQKYSDVSKQPMDLEKTKESSEPLFNFKLYL